MFIALGLKSNPAPLGAECVERFTSHYAPKGAEEYFWVVARSINISP